MPHDAAGIGRSMIHDAAGCGRIADHDAAGVGRSAIHDAAGIGRIADHDAAGIGRSMIHHAAGIGRIADHDAPGGLKPTPVLARHGPFMGSCHQRGIIGVMTRTDRHRAAIITHRSP
jgi:hypothetical protein